MPIDELIQKLVVPPLVGIVWLFLYWVWLKNVRSGNPLRPIERRLLAFGCVFIVGMGYMIAWNDAIATVFNLPGRAVWMPLAALWGIALGYFVWRRYRLEYAAAVASGRISSRVFIEGIARAGLLISLIGSIIEWVSVAEKDGHLWVALLWTAACGAMLLLLRNRRAPVLIALRLLLVLAVIGAIDKPSIASTVIVLAVSATFIITKKLWPEGSTVDDASRLESTPPKC